MLTREQYDAIAEAEVRLYSDSPGCHGYTDIMDLSDIPTDDPVHDMWTIASMAVDQGESLGERWILSQTAKRVAQAFALLNFGAEFLLK